MQAMIDNTLINQNYKKVLSFMDEISSSNNNFQKEVLLAFERWFGFHQMNFWLFDENNYLIEPVTLNTDESITNDYLKNYTDTDKLLPHNLMHIISKYRVIGLLDIQTKEEHENSKFYNNFMKKNRFYNDTAIYLIKNSKVIGMVDYVSDKKERELGQNERMSLEILSRYLTQETYAYVQKNKIRENPNKVKQILTSREKEVLELVRQGYSNKEISNKLFISINTVKKHVQSLYQKFEVNNRTSLSFKSK